MSFADDEGYDMPEEEIERMEQSSVMPVRIDAEAYYAGYYRLKAENTRLAARVAELEKERSGLIDNAKQA